MTKNRCAKCGKGEIKFENVRNFETLVRGEPFTVPEARIGRCESCGERFFEPNEIRRWQRLYESDLLQKGKLLGADQIRRIREELKLPINQFARLLGATRQSVYNWERHDRKSPQMRLADLLLRLIDESMKTGTVDVVKFLREQAGLDEAADPPHRASHERINPFRRRIICRPSWEYEQAVGAGSGPQQLPRLQIC